MPGIIEYPTLVQNALAQYGELFANECSRRHHAEHLTGLLAAEQRRRSSASTANSLISRTSPAFQPLLT